MKDTIYQEFILGEGKFTVEDYKETSYALYMYDSFVTEINDPTDTKEAMGKARDYLFSPIHRKK